MSDISSETTSGFFHEGMRLVQSRMDTTRLADRLEELKTHDTFDERDRAFIESASMVFIATADADGRPDCSYKGGYPGFIRVMDETTLAIPSYDGNGQYRTVGNIEQNHSLGLLFVDFIGKSRLRANGTARVVTSGDDASFVASFVGAEMVVVFTLQYAFGNCPRYINDPTANMISEFAPREGHTPPQPEWKTREAFRHVLPQPNQMDAGSKEA
jgi:uncharacterized protein